MKQDSWQQVAGPELNYAFKKRASELKGMPISQAILEAAGQGKANGGLGGCSPRQVMFYALDYLQNANVNREGPLSTGLNNMDDVKNDESVEIFLEGDRWKLRVLKSDGEVRMEGFLFPPKPESSSRPEDPPAETLTAPPKMPETPKTPETPETPETARRVNYYTEETSPERQERESLSFTIKETLVGLNALDAELERQGVSISETLKSISASLEKLKQKYPNDPDIYPLQMAYEDLKGDFDADEEVTLDESFLQMIEEMRSVMEASGVRQVSMDHLDRVSPSLRSTTERLESLNIHPSYVVASPNPAAKTVVLFMQIHGQPMGEDGKIASETDHEALIREAMGDSMNMDETKALYLAIQSQKQIEAAIVNAVESGLVRNVYEEGMPQGEEFRIPNLPSGISDDQAIEKIAQFVAKESGQKVEDVRQNLNVGTLRAELKLGDRMRLLGYDVDTLKEQTLEGKSDFYFRMNAQNVLIASNVAEYSGKYPNEKVSFLTIGSAHEAYPSGKEHPIPLSHTLAYYGMNVIVVDASKESLLSST